ncbi:glycerol-3-phosphate phosphatase [Copidosoma floridanum]|uniref:glycerol-3-phosphate phosphatase n=1 Tax=Copidosoma floridanum TaxID=29053 RepID=UPI0006C997DF|nr:glycerol-3-phosphate phosphatase [Copidosoma floridanum]
MYCTVNRFLHSSFNFGQQFLAKNVFRHSKMSAINLKSLNSDEINKFLDSFDTVLTDCDGVLWLDNESLPDSAAVMNLFKECGKKTFYVTNNSTKTREELAKKCECLNFNATEEDILCTSHLAANYLKQEGYKGKVYVIGKTGITRELEKVGITHCGTGPDVLKDLDSFRFEKDPEVKAVIVGYDEHFSYPKMIKAASYLNDPSVYFVATNTDERFPTSDNVIVPGTGSMVRCIETCAERKALIMGKPEPYVAEMIKKNYHVNPERTLMIGDRSNTDILLGTRCHFKTLLVLSGVTKIEEVEKWKLSSAKEDRDLVPNYYIKTLGDLLPYLKEYKPSN